LGASFFARGERESEDEGEGEEAEAGDSTKLKHENERDEGSAFDTLCLVLGLLMNLVQVMDDAKMLCEEVVSFFLLFFFASLMLTETA